MRSPTLLVIPALSRGPEAVALRDTAGQGRVLAVLRNAVYLAGDEGYVIGIVGSAAPDGPLTVRVPDLLPLLQRLRDQQNVAFHASPTALDIDGIGAIAWAHAAPWTPTLPATLGPPAARAAAADTLAASLPAFVLPSTDGGGTEANNLKSTIHNLKSLIGRGPGLTPAGDDLLMGLLAALYWQVRLGAIPPEPVAALSTAVLAAAPQQTTRLSARLLTHAADGILYEPAMELGAALLAGDPAAVPAPTRRLCAIGHTSGTDLAHGLLIGTRLGRDPLALAQGDNDDDLHRFV